MVQHNAVLLHRVSLFDLVEELFIQGWRNWLGLQYTLNIIGVIRASPLLSLGLYLERSCLWVHVFDIGSACRLKLHLKHLGDAWLVGVTLGLVFASLAYFDLMCHNWLLHRQSHSNQKI